MGRFSVADVMLGEFFFNYMGLIEIYSQYDPLYAVYRTRDRVAIQFADDPAVEAVQRRAFAKLLPLRSEINGFIDGWRTSPRRRFQSATRRYDRDVAAALTAGLQGDLDIATACLSQTRDRIVAERTARARFLYLIWAAGAVAAIILAAAQIR